MKGKKYYYNKKNPARKWLTIYPTLLFLTTFLIWDRVDRLRRIFILAAIPGLIYYYLMFAFCHMSVDDEGVKANLAIFWTKVIPWEELKSVRWNPWIVENRKWIHNVVGRPIFAARVYPKKGGGINISSALTDWDELIETLLEECDRRGLGEKVEYKVRQKLWEYQDAKREEEEWEDEEMEEEWEEEEDE